MKPGNTNRENKHDFYLLEKESMGTLQGESNEKFGRSLKPHPNIFTGFTILEVMVALAIVGISIGIFFSLIGNSSKLRGKIDDHTKLVLLARTKTEEAFLGILGKKHTKVEEKKTFEGSTKEGIQWKVSETDKYKESMKKIGTGTVKIDTDESNDESNIDISPKGTTLVSTQVEGINIETIIFSEESDADESDSEKDTDGEEYKEDEKGSSKFKKKPGK